jgi:ABC-type ATPase with predicted acetyltransferase domain
LIESGRGDRQVTDARFRCRDCGALVEKQLRPPVPQLGGSVAYIQVARR